MEQMLAGLAGHRWQSADCSTAAKPGVAPSCLLNLLVGLLFTKQCTSDSLSIALRTPSLLQGPGTAAPIYCCTPVCLPFLGGINKHLQSQTGLAMHC